MTDEAIDTEAGRIESIDTLRDKVDRILEMLSGQHAAGSESDPDEPEPDPKAEMKAELAKLQAAEKRKQEREAAAKADADWKASVEQRLTEKPPQEHKRSTRFMRWRDEDDK